MRSYEALLSGLLVATEAKLDKCPGNDGKGEIAQKDFVPNVDFFSIFLPFSIFFSVPSFLMWTGGWMQDLPMGLHRR